VAKIQRVMILSVLFVAMIGTFSSPLAEAGIPPPPDPDLTISKEGPPGMVKMADANGPTNMKNLNDGDIVRVCNNLQNENNVLLTVRDKDGKITHQQTLMPRECVDLVVGSAQLPGGGTKFKVSGGSFINVDACSEEQGLTEFSLGTCPAIGGKIIPTETTALLLAGAQTSALWILPVILAGVGLIAFRKIRS